jgi:uncharacterized Zn-finger protein
LNFYFFIFKTKKINTNFILFSIFLRCHYDGCNKSYLCRMYLNSHITKSHLNDSKEKSLRNSKANVKSVESSELKIENIPEITSSLNLETHISSLSSANIIKGFVEQNEVKLFKCTFEKCKKEFSTSSKLHRHNLTHLRSRKFKCSYENCDATFNRQDHLLNHIKIHDSIKPYNCDYPSRRSF